MFRFNFYVVLLALSAVLLYSLGSNLLFLVSSGKRKMLLRCQTLSLCQQTVNLACHEDLTIALPGYCMFPSGPILWQTGCVSSIMIYV